MHGHERDPRAYGIASRYAVAGQPGEAWRPALEVYETEAALVVHVELAGIDQENLGVAFDGDVLMIEGERHSPEHEADASERRQYHEMGVPYGSFKARLQLPFPVNRDATEAEYEHGFLTVRLPRMARATTFVSPVEETKAVSAVGTSEANAECMTRKDNA